MIKFQLGSRQKNDSPFIYKWGFECLGQVVEVSLTRSEWDKLKEKGRKIFSKSAQVKPYLNSVQRSINKKRRTASAPMKASHPEQSL